MIYYDIIGKGFLMINGIWWRWVGRGCVNLCERVIRSCVWLCFWYLVVWDSFLLLLLDLWFWNQ